MPTSFGQTMITQTTSLLVATLLLFLNPVLAAEYYEDDDLPPEKMLIENIGKIRKIVPSKSITSHIRLPISDVEISGITTGPPPHQVYYCFTRDFSEATEHELGLIDDWYEKNPRACENDTFLTKMTNDRWVLSYGTNWYFLRVYDE